VQQAQHFDHFVIGFASYAEHHEMASLPPLAGYVKGVHPLADVAARSHACRRLHRGVLVLDARTIIPVPMLNAERLDVRRGRTSYSPIRAEMLVAVCMAIGIALATNPACAISLDRSLSQLHHESWTARDGAPASAYMIAQTTDGFL
jgi:hypothetical protein